MFPSVDHHTPRPERPTEAIVRCVRELFALVVAFLTLEDDYVPDWAVEPVHSTELSGLRVVAEHSSRRARHPHRQPLARTTPTQRRKGTVAASPHHCLSPVSAAAQRRAERRSRPATRH
jgi:hypothetical protein